MSALNVSESGTLFYIFISLEDSLHLKTTNFHMNEEKKSNKAESRLSLWIHRNKNREVSVLIVSTGLTDLKEEETSVLVFKRRTFL